jgi:hypothetical protein
MMVSCSGRNGEALHAAAFARCVDDGPQHLFMNQVTADAQAHPFLFGSTLAIVTPLDREAWSPDENITRN